MDNKDIREEFEKQIEIWKETPATEPTDNETASDDYVTKIVADWWIAKISQARKDERIKTLEEAMKVVEERSKIILPENHTDNGKTIFDWEGQDLFNRGQLQSLSATHQALLELRNKE